MVEDAGSVPLVLVCEPEPVLVVPLPVVPVPVLVLPVPVAPVPVVPVLVVPEPVGPVPPVTRPGRPAAAAPDPDWAEVTSPMSELAPGARLTPAAWEASGMGTALADAAGAEPEPGNSPEFR